MTVPDTAPAGHVGQTSVRTSEGAIQPSINLFADSIFTNGLGAAPAGLIDNDDDFESVEDLLPPSQRLSPVMLAAHASVDRQLGSSLTTLTLPELQALHTQVTLREKQLLTACDDHELFSKPTNPSTQKDAPASVAEKETSPSGAVVPEHSSEPPAGADKLSRLEYAKVRQENVNLSNVVCIRATADLVTELRHPDAAIDMPGRRQGKTPLVAATQFVATALRVTKSTIDKRLTAANAMWPDMDYRRSRTVTPHLAAQLQRGRLAFDSMVAAQEKLTSIRQAVRRAGGDDEMADDVVRHKERDFVRHALRNDPHTFGRFAKSQSDAVTNELIGPRQTLTSEQVKHEKGIFYEAPIGGSLHRLSLVVDDAELLQLTAIREFATKLDSTISTLRAQAHQDATAENSDADALSKTPHTDTGPDSTSRLTDEDIDLGIGKLFDGQTQAERWLNTLLDFVGSGLILHKTYDPHATPEEERRRKTSLAKAAAHSETLNDILGMHETPDVESQVLGAQDNTSATTANRDASADPLATLIPPGYQLLRPNLDLIVELTLQDLIGSPRDHPVLSGSQTSKDEDSELEKLLWQLKQNAQGLSAPVASPGNIKIDHSLARQQACHQRIIPMVLGTASQPLDVGRAQRSFSPAMRRALHVRDRGCVVPGCPRPAPWCEPHHLEEWAHGGSTAVTNGALLCRQHHTAVHRGLLVIHMEADGRPSCSLPARQDPTQTRYRNVYWTG